MRLKISWFVFAMLMSLISAAQTASPSFDMSDTVCVGDPVQITNTSTGASNYYWSFCSADLAVEPEIQNLGNINGAFTQPVFLDYVFTNNKYYGFVTNYSGGNLIRLDFGNSLLNTPSVHNLGNFNGLLPANVGSEGIQVVQNEGKWYAIIVSGYTPSGSTPKVIRIAFGTDIENNNPVATNWGNLGNMYQPIDLHLFQENNVWYGLTVSAENNTITRFNFTSSFENTPTATNLGNIGQLAYPTGLYAINDRGTWRVFITNAGDRTRTGGEFSLTRLDFGNSLLNIPVGTNLGNLSNMLGHPRDLTIMRSCDQIIGFVVNGNPGYNNIVRIDFNNDLTSQPSPTTLAINSFQFPHSISKLFRVNEDVYGFITDAQNGTISRIRFRGCNNSSIPSSTARNPGSVTYNLPGTYNVNLTIDIGLPTQASFCRQVVVDPCIADIVLSPDTTICEGQSVTVRTNPAAAYRWTPTSGINDARSATPTFRPTQTTRYYVDATLPNNSVVRDSITITVLPPPAVSISNDTLVCAGSPVQLRATGGGTYSWAPAPGLSGANSATPSVTPFQSNTYKVRVTANNGCYAEDSVRLDVRPYPIFRATGDASLCKGEAALLSASGGDSYNWAPAALVDDPRSSTTSARPASDTTFSVTISENTCGMDTTIHIPVRIHQNPNVTATSTNDINCTTPTSQLLASGAVSYAWSPATGLDDPAIANPVVSVDTTTTFQVVGTNEFGCSASANVTVPTEKGGVATFLVPNAFTPNNDGRNDCFGIRRWGNVEVELFTVYNRWGQKVFETRNVSECWNGTFNGKTQDAGGFVYVIRANTFCGLIQRTGFVTLIR